MGNCELREAIFKIRNNLAEALAQLAKVKDDFFAS